jgi:hypothetical protein
MINDNFLQLKYELGSYIGQYPTYYELWCRLVRPNALARFASPDTDIVIEGFPRSGNTFAVAAFIIAQGCDVKIARHTHKVMQIIRAVELQLPILILIRRPDDAVISLRIRHPYISFKQALKNYIRYYNGIKSYKKGFYLARFEDVTTDYRQVIQHVNNKFHTEFKLFENSLENQQKAFRLVEEMHLVQTGNSSIDEAQVPRPSEERKKVKEKFYSDLEKKELKMIRGKANNIYEELLQSNQI